MSEIRNLTEEQKETITEWAEEKAEFDKGDLVTVDYTSDDSWFANAEFGGIPMIVQQISWRRVSRIRGAGLYHYEEEDAVDELLKLYDDEDEPEYAGDWTPYVRPRITYKLDRAIDTRKEVGRPMEESCLITWEDYDGDLQFRLRNEDGTTSLREGESCRVCSFDAERVSESSLPDGTRYGQTECAVCGYVKQENPP